MTTRYEAIDAAAARIRRAHETRTPARNLRDLLDGSDVDAGYAVQEINTGHWLESGRRLVGRKIGRIGVGFYASKAYAETHGLPSRREEWKDHRIVSFGGVAAEVELAKWLAHVTEGGTTALRCVADADLVQAVGPAADRRLVQLRILAIGQPPQVLARNQRHHDLPMDAEVVLEVFAQGEDRTEQKRDRERIVGFRQPVGEDPDHQSSQELNAGAESQPDRVDEEDGLIAVAGDMRLQPEMFHQQNRLPENEDQSERGADREQKDVETVLGGIQRVAGPEQRREAQNRAAETAEQRPEQPLDVAARGIGQKPFHLAASRRSRDTGPPWRARVCESAVSSKVHNQRQRAT